MTPTATVQSIQEVCRGGSPAAGHTDTYAAGQASSPPKSKIENTSGSPQSQPARHKQNNRSIPLPNPCSSSTPLTLSGADVSSSALRGILAASSEPVTGEVGHQGAKSQRHGVSLWARYVTPQIPILQLMMKGDPISWLVFFIFQSYIYFSLKQSK
jgi:hypothetical protein